MPVDYNQLYTVQGIGRGGQGDPFITLNNKRVYIEGAPREMKQGDTLALKVNSFRPSPGQADFAKYRNPIELERQAPQQEQPASELEQEIWYVYIGTSSRGDMSAIARIPGDSEILGMGAYDALTMLIRQHEDSTIYRQSTDRRIAGDISRIYESAEGDNALDELEYTLGNKPVTSNTKTPLREYFSTKEGKHRAQSTVERKKDQKAETPKKPKPRKQTHARVRRTGSPG